MEEEIPQALLLAAASAGDVDGVTRALATGAVADGVASGDWLEWSALLYAASAGHASVVHALLEAGARNDWVSSTRDTALHIAVRDGHANVVDVLLAAPSAPINAINEASERPLTLAMCMNRRDIVRTLLAAGANPNISVVRDTNALMSAVKLGMGDMVDLLLANGADVNFEREWNKTTALADAIRSESAEMVEKLLAAGANVHHTFNGTYTPLIYAASLGHDRIVRLLLSAGANINEEMQDLRHTALTVAVYKARTDVVELLLETEGVDVDHTTAGGNTAFLLAAGTMDVEILMKLLAADANLHHINSTGETALMRATIGGMVENVELLLRLGVPVDTADTDGSTALLHASRNGRAEVTEMLLAAGPTRIDDANNDGETPLAVATKERHADVVEILLAWGADQPQSVDVDQV